MNERVKFIARYLQKDEPFSALCELAGVSRKTGYKWVARYEGGGVIALVDRSRAPQSHPHAVPAEIIGARVSTLAPGGLSRLAVWCVRLGSVRSGFCRAVPTKRPTRTHVQYSQGGHAAAPAAHPACAATRP